MGLLDGSKGGRIWILSDDIVSFLFHLEMPREMDFKEIVLYYLQCTVSGN